MKIVEYNIMDIIRQMYSQLQARDSIQLDIPRSDVFYVRAAIKQALGIELDIYAVEQLLQEEFNYKP